MSEFEMSIDEVFNFADGRTVFVGAMTGDDIVTTTECTIEIDEVVVAELQVEGEMLPNQKSDANVRSISTMDTLPRDVDFRGARLVSRPCAQEQAGSES